MKKYIFLFILLMIGCNEPKELEKNIATEINTSSKDIRIKAEDSLYKNLLIEENSREEPLIQDEKIDESNKTKIYNDKELTKLIGNMFIVGFYGTDINTKSQIVKDIENYHLGGVILFDKHPSRKGKAKNIQNPKQLKKLTQKLQDYSSYTLFIATDQEGGKVARLKKKTGFKKDYPSAKDISTKYDSVKTEKESKALQLEEEIAKEQVAFANNEIVRLDEIVTAKEVQLEELKKELASEEEDVKELQEAVAKTISQYNDSKTEISKNKSDLIDQIDQKILSFYEKLKDGQMKQL